MIYMLFILMVSETFAVHIANNVKLQLFMKMFHRLLFHSLA